MHFAKYILKMQHMYNTWVGPFLKNAKKGVYREWRGTKPTLWPLTHDTLLRPCWHSAQLSLCIASSSAAK